MLEIRTRPTVEHHDLAGDNGDQPQGERPERVYAGLRVPGRTGTVHLPRVHAELMFDPVPHGVHSGHVRLSHVFLHNAR